jgi:hypothetical protein
MALWGNLDASNNAPVFADTGGYGATANTQDASIFGNVTIGATRSDVAMGMFGVDTTEKEVTGDGKNATHAGWILRTAGTGPITSITANSGAVGTNSYLTIAGGGVGNTAANAQISVNAAGYIVAVTLNSGGSYSTTPTVTPASGNGVFTVTMGGRANRVIQETLVAMGSMTGDASDDTYYPDA